jgi:hypothetical protein
MSKEVMHFQQQSNAVRPTETSKRIQWMPQIVIEQPYSTWRTSATTHELLNNPGIPGRNHTFWGNNGPFGTVDEFKEKAKILYDWELSFSNNTAPVFDHMDWFMCNVLIDQARENVVAVLDWEKAGFIPDPEGNFLAGASESIKAQMYPWLTLLDL